MQELKPCPFCGNEAVVLDDDHVLCRYCGARGPRNKLDSHDLKDGIITHPRMEQAIKDWNKRSEDS